MDHSKRTRRRPTRFTEDEEVEIVKPKKKSTSKSNKRSAATKNDKVLPIKVSASVKLSRPANKSKIVEKVESIKIGRSRYSIDDVSTLTEIISSHLSDKEQPASEPFPGKIEWNLVSTEVKRRRQIDWNARECQRIWLYLAYGKLSSEHHADIDGKSYH
eukprot:CAMPEP_0117765926 /NCGR_PEP_ID=MMETSP0947-20121206/20478_1 /TAXON_ID=44440 /ORGANISM="Chattonella subsalsa, Strain CCMP2191" /LENGTH=158 /DNA_ID=CAMNT_0005588825 /DNA_START=51 /DNA_END=524 /DNA_ORIENTATION=+